MAITVFKTFLEGEILTAGDLNSSFTKITDNALALISPVTGNLDMDGNSLVLDDDGDTSIKASTDDVIDLVAGGATLWKFDGGVASPINGLRFRAAATGTAPSIEVIGNPNRNLNLAPSGTGVLEVKGVALTALSDLHLANESFS